MGLNLTNLNQDVLDIIKSMDLKDLEKEIENDYKKCLSKIETDYHYYDRGLARDANSEIRTECNKKRDEQLKLMKLRKIKLKFLLKNLL